MTYYERNLPHWHPEGRAIFLTWRLHGSLPKEFVRQLAKFTGDPGKQFFKAESMLDGATSGPRWLSEPRIVGYVEDAIQRSSELGHCVLHAYVIMANHVHVLLEPKASLRRITGGIKGVSAREANRLLGRWGSHSGRKSRSIIGFAMTGNLSEFELTSRKIP